MNADDKIIGSLIFDIYKVEKKLGSGSFGSIYSASYNGENFAIKFEDKKSDNNLLQKEAYIMSYLGGPGLPIVKSYGSNNSYNILVMELMGDSLEDIFSLYERKFYERCVCNVGYQMIEIIEYVHNRHIIHRDIKPDNFVVGLGDKKKYIYLLDFGLARKYRSSKTLAHYKKEENKSLIGTARYASINALRGITQSRRDDLEAIGYVLMYFLRGRLPWQGIQAKTKEERYQKILKTKIATRADDLCHRFPDEFTKFINYTRNLEYEEEPDYNYLKDLLVSILRKQNYNIDCYYDWDNETVQYLRDFKNYKNPKGSVKIYDIFSSQKISPNTEIIKINKKLFDQNKIINTGTIISDNNKKRIGTLPIMNKNDIANILNDNNQIVRFPYYKNNNNNYLINNTNFNNNNNNNDMRDISMNNNINSEALNSFYNPNNSALVSDDNNYNQYATSINQNNTTTTKTNNTNNNDYNPISNKTDKDDNKSENQFVKRKNDKKCSGGCCCIF